MSKIRELIAKEIPDNRFILDAVDIPGEKTDRPALAQRDTRRVVVAVHRKVVGPFINRSESDEDTIPFSMKDKTLIRIPARKWKSMEKLRGLEMCRAYDVVDPAYEYNDIRDSNVLANPVSVLFGDTVAQSGDTAGIPSHYVYGDGLSLQEVSEATGTLTHNALSEMGTMWQRARSEGDIAKFRMSLFETTYVLPGTDIIQFIAIDAPTPESLAFLLLCLDANRYGAAKQALGVNIKNRVIGIYATNNEPPVTPYSLLEDNDIKTMEEAIPALHNAWNNWGEEGRIIIDEKAAEELRKGIRSSVEKKDLFNQLKKEAILFHEYVYRDLKKKAKKKAKK